MCKAKDVFMNRLKECRRTAGLTLEELAKLLGVTRQAINGWEKGSRKIPDDRKSKLAEIFGVDEAAFDEQQDDFPDGPDYVLDSGIIIENQNKKSVETNQSRYKRLSIYSDYIEKLNVKKAKQKELEKRIHKNISGIDKSLMTEQIDQIDLAVQLYGHFNQIVEKLDDIAPDDKDKYISRIIEFLYAIETAMGCDINKDISDEAKKSDLKQANIVQAEKLFKKALKDG